MNNRSVIGALGVLILGVGTGVRGETYTLETYYPAPVGVYKWIKADFQDFYGYTGNVDAGGAPPAATMPAPGRLFYNRDLNGYYFSSSAGVANDPTTWYKSVSGLDQEIAGQGTKASFVAPNNASVWITNLSASIGTITGSGNNTLRSSKKYASPGLFTVGVEGTFCTGSLGTYEHPTVTVGSGPNPSFSLYYRKFSCPTTACASTNSWTSWIALGNSIENLELDAAGCSPFEMEAVVMLTPGRGIAMGVKFKRDIPGDAITNVTYRMKRVLSF